MAGEKLEPVTMENVKIIFRNFKGREGKYNQEGDRNFGVLIENDAVANAMAEDGWNIKWLKPRDDAEEEETPTAWLPISAEYRKGKPPRVVMVTDRGRSNLGEDEVEMIDWADITNVDLIVNPSFWDVNGNTGYKAYLRSMYVTIEEDELEKKYSLEEQ